MEFWGLEVQPGQTITVNPGDNKYLHLSQITLGEVKKEKTAAASVFVKFDDKKLVLGTLSADKCSQIQSDLVFEKEFELFHGSKNTSVYFLGYKTAANEEDDDISDPFGSDSESEEDIPLVASANGKPEAKANDNAAKPNAKKAETSVGKAKIKVEEPEKYEKPKTKGDEDDDDTEEDDSDDDESEDDEDEEMVDGQDDDSDDEDESSDKEEEATPKKAEVGKKRPADSASKTPVPGKKAKLVSPDVEKQKTGLDGKKESHVATPFPAKQGKTPANSDKSSKQQTPKSTGSVACKSCSKTFNSENALQSHTKAKHSTGK